MRPLTFNPHDKIELFIDLQNLLKVVGPENLDLIIMAMCIADGRNVGSAFVYDMLIPNDPVQARIHAELKRNGFKIVTPPGHCGNREKQVGVDVNMAIDISDRASTSHCDVIVIVSGDGDFTPVIDNVYRKGKKVEVAAFESATNKSLIDSVDRYIPLDSLPILRPRRD